MLVPRFSGHEHIVNRALGGKNRGIYPSDNLYERLLEVFGVPDGGIDTHESGSVTAESGMNLAVLRKQCYCCELLKS